MFLLTLGAVPTVLCAVFGLLIWFVLRLFRLRKGRLVARFTFLSWVLLLPIFVLVITPALFSYLIANASTRPMDLKISTTPSDFHREYQDVVFSSQDGLRLSGWLMPGNEDKVPLVMTHGLFRSRQEILARACQINAAGHPVLLFDLRNHGSSEHRTITLGFSERLDVQGAASYLMKKTGKKQVSLFGVSMGAAAVLLASPGLADSVAQIVADSPFASLRETVSHHAKLLMSLPSFPFTQVFVWNLSRIGRFDDNELDTEAALRSMGPVPLLLIYGADDERMPRPIAQKLFDSALGTNKKLLFFEDASHGGAYDSDPDKYVEAILGWISDTPG